MKNSLIIFFLGLVSFVQSQNVQLAYDYFRKGEYAKSATIYKKLFEKNNNNKVYFKKLLTCYQQQEKYQLAKELINKQRISFPNHYYLDVEMGHNYELQDLNQKAEPLYQKALAKVNENPVSARLTGRSFQNNNKLDYALQTYELAMKLKPSLNFNLYLASIYGEKMQIDKMFNAYLNMVENSPNYYTTVQRYVGKFISDDTQNENNVLFKQTLVRRLQNNPLDAWNNLLSWLFMQQKEYYKALLQEIGVFKRSTGDLTKIFELAKVATDDSNYKTANKAYSFIKGNTNNQIDILIAEQQLLHIGILTAKTNEELQKVNTKFNELFTEYGKGKNTVNLQIAYADFLTFKQNKPDEAITILNQASKLASSKFVKGNIKIKLADILVFNNKFNQALVRYTQVQSDLRGSEIAQIARLKVAKTSYYKGDFDWAKTQLKVLKSATSKLISNDALKLNLLIGDNIVDDSIRTALKKYAKAELLAFQNKNNMAIDSLTVLIKKFKGHSIEDEALFLQATLYQKTNQFEFAEHSYNKLIAIKEDGILVDDALYNLGLLFQNELKDNEKAKEMYQKIIFKFASSIYLVDARKRYRKLRGDVIEN